MEQEKKQYFVEGQVQGVFFRASTCKKAQELGVFGWVKNLDDGRVKVYAEADHETMKTFYQWLKKGPPMARVSQVLEAKIDADDSLNTSPHAYKLFSIV